MTPDEFYEALKPLMTNGVPFCNACKELGVNYRTGIKMLGDRISEIRQIRTMWIERDLIYKVMELEEFVRNNNE